MLAADGGGAAAQVSMGAGMASLGQQMASFRDAAAAGQFSVNDAGGKALLGAIDEMQRWLQTKRRYLDQLSQNGQYGSTHAAKVVEPYMNDVATDDGGLVLMLRKFESVLGDATKAINKAMVNYQQTDADSAGRVNQAGGRRAV